MMIRISIVGLFAIIAIAFAIGAYQARWLRDRRHLRRATAGALTFAVLTGLSLWASLHYGLFSPISVGSPGFGPEWNCTNYEEGSEFCTKNPLPPTQPPAPAVN
jgi:hypothetical protein